MIHNKYDRTKFNRSGGQTGGSGSGTTISGGTRSTYRFDRTKFGRSQRRLDDVDIVAPLTGSTFAAGTEITFTATSGAADYVWQFGDGATAAGLSVTHTYTSPGSYTVTLTASVSGEQKSKTISISVGNPPSAVILAPVITQHTYGIELQFRAQTVPNAVYSWDFGDGAAATGLMPTHTYTAGEPDTAPYTVTLTVTNPYGVSTETRTLELCKPIPAIITTPAQGITDVWESNEDTLQFGAQIPSSETLRNLAVYSWNFGDGDTAGTSSTSHRFANGNYTVTLSVSNQHDYTDTQSITVHIGDLPVISIPEPVSDRHTYGQQIQFRCQSEPDTTYTWQFGDGESASGSSVTHAYTAGTDDIIKQYTVTLTAVNSYGTKSGTKILHISKPIQAKITVPDVLPGEGFWMPNTTPLSFEAQAPAPGQLNQNAVYSWDFGDGSDYYTQRIGSHSYANGDYTLTLTVDNQYNYTETTSITVHVGDLPVINILTPAGQGLRQTYGQTVHYTCQTESNASYVWDFGDGVMANGGAVTHAYTAGTDDIIKQYTVLLTATNPYGHSSGSITLDVSKPIHATIVSPAPAQDETDIWMPNTTPLSFEAASPDSGLTAVYSWDFGDGSARSSQRTGSHSYANGDYTLTLTVDNQYNYTETTSIIVHVGDLPVAEITAPSDNSKHTYTQSIEFACQTESNASYVWQFGDGATASGSTTAHIYNRGDTDGVIQTYSITLTATNPYGTKSDSISLELCETVTAVIISPAESAYKLRDELLPFEAQEISPPRLAEVCSYAWNFGDSTPESADRVTEHTYTETGDHTISLTIDNGHGYSSTATQIIHIGLLPVAEITAPLTPDWTYDVDDIEFSCTVEPDTTYSWNYGDNTPDAAGSTTQHRYASAGSTSVQTFTVTLTAGSHYGVTTDTCELELCKPWPAKINNPSDDESVPKIPVSQPITFIANYPNDSILAPEISYTWEFGDGTSFDGDAIVTHTYDSAHTYTVRLIVDNHHGYITEDIVVIELGVPPIVRIDLPADDTKIVVGETILFSAALQYSNTASWDLGDGTIESGLILTHAYDYGTASVIDVICTASNDYGSGSDRIKLRVDVPTWSIINSTKHKSVPLLGLKFAMARAGISGMANLTGEPQLIDTTDNAGEYLTALAWKGRTVDFVVYIKGADRSELESNRQELIDVFGYKESVKIIWNQESGRALYLTGTIARGYPDIKNGTAPKHQAKLWTACIQLYCADPFWYLHGAPLEMDGETNIADNIGNVETPCWFDCTADEVRNVTTGAAIKAAAGQTLVGVHISTVRGHVSATQNGENVFYKLSLDSDLFMLAPGENEITGAENLKFRPRWTGS